MHNCEPMTESKYRSDIDGLRAIAILSVILYHADFSFFSGGFVGVDIFFVISGYLITQLILRDIKTNNFSFLNFYQRRIRRLMPAAIVVFSTTVIFSIPLLTPRHFVLFGKSLMTALISISNVFFWKQTGYFNVQSLYKPLLHTWSLSVEEQFYLFWPLCLFLSYKFLKKNTWVFILLLGLGSLLLNYFFLDQPETIFYLTPFRVFELCIGGLLVYIQNLDFLKNHRRLYELMCFIGLAMMSATIVLYSNKTTFPYIAALLPCLGSALVILSANQSKTGSFLKLPPMTFIGRISYSLYLIHWPVFVFYRYWKFNECTLTENIILILLSIVLAYFLYTYIEQPFRQIRNSQYRISNFKMAARLAPMMLGLYFLGMLISREKFEDFRMSWNPNSSSVQAAMSLPTCEDDFGICPESKSASDMALIGDSHSNAIYLYASLAVMNKKRLFRYPGLPACFPVFNNTLDCQDEMNSRLEEIISKKIPTVILASNWSLMSHQYKAEWLLDHLNETLQKFQKANIRVLVWGAMPFHIEDIGICLNRPIPQKCPEKMVPTNNAEQIKFNNDLRQLVQKNHAYYFDLFDTLCSENECAVSYDGHSLYSDVNHLEQRLFGALVHLKYTKKQPLTFEELFK